LKITRGSVGFFLPLSFGYRSPDLKAILLLFAARYEKKLPRNRFQPTAVDFYHFLIKVRYRRHYIRQIVGAERGGELGRWNGVEGVDFLFYRRMKGGRE